jgi:hypothetical protein
MRYTPLVVAALAALTFAGAASAQQTAAPAAKLEVGQWTGSVTPPDGGTAEVKYDVTYAGDTLKIKINAGDHGSFDTWAAKLEGNKLSFKFRPGPEITCVLERKELFFSGTCAEDDPTRGVATIDMSPPKKTETK